MQRMSDRRIAASMSCSPKCLDSAYGSCGRIGWSSSIGAYSGVQSRSGKKNPGTVSLETLTNRGTPEADRRLERVERRQQVVREDRVRRVVLGVGYRRRVDHGVVPADHRERVAGVGEVGARVDGRAGEAALEDRRAEI